MLSYSEDLAIQECVARDVLRTESLEKLNKMYTVEILKVLFEVSKVLKDYQTCNAFMHQVRQR